MKVDGSNVSTKLPGAEFDLYRYEGTKDDPTEADLKDDNHKVGHYVSSDDGALAISGLKKVIITWLRLRLRLIMMTKETSIFTTC